jgi:hypothetical protein
MKSITNGNMRLEYESALGDNFLLMQEWAEMSLNPTELEVYARDELTPEKQALFDRWTADQQIISLKIYIDDVLQS